MEAVPSPSIVPTTRQPTRIRSVSKAMAVLSYIAGFSAPPGKTMGHAGAIISGSAGTAQGKKEALEARGIQVGTTPTEVAQLVADRMK